MPVIQHTFTVVIEDRKRKKATVSFTYQLPAALPLNDENIDSALGDMMLLIDELVDGQIVSANLSRGIPLPVGLKNSIAVNADVEERGVFKFRTISGFYSIVGLPTFKEQFVVVGTREIDRAATEIIDFVAELITPSGVGVDNLAHYSDSRGADLVVLADAYEQFRPR